MHNVFFASMALATVLLLFAVIRIAFIACELQKIRFIERLPFLPEYKMETDYEISFEDIEQVKNVFLQKLTVRSQKILNCRFWSFLDYSFGVFERVKRMVCLNDPNLFFMQTLAPLDEEGRIRAQACLYRSQGLKEAQEAKCSYRDLNILSYRLERHLTKYERHARKALYFFGAEANSKARDENLDIIEDIHNDIDVIAQDLDKFAQLLYMRDFYVRASLPPKNEKEFDSVIGSCEVNMIDGGVFQMDLGG